jgi:hypothetical protein
VLFAIASCSSISIAQTGPEANVSTAASQNVSEVLKNLDRVIDQNQQLEKQNQQLMEQITALRHALAAQSAATQETTDSAARADDTDAQQTVTAQTSQTQSSAQSSAQPSAQSGTSQTQSSAQSSAQPGTSQTGTYTPPEAREPEMWGEWNPGQGFKVAETQRGSLNLSGYLVARYLNQFPANQTAVDHLGRPIAVQPRQDFQFHRVMLYASGWFLDPKFKYFTFVWTVNDTTQVAVGGSLSYEFNKSVSLGMGINALPISRTVQGNHPYWPSYDRVMADEFFRPFFTQGFFGQGQLARGLFYKWMTGNNLSTLGVKATQLDRSLNFGGSLTWMPSTGEFGPRGALGDFEEHDKLATRFGVGWGFSRENRQSNENDPVNNTTIRLADSLNVFDTGALANGVTVRDVTWHLLAADAGFKKHGLWVGGEGYYRLLDNFKADGPLPVGSIRDTGFYVQAAYMVVPKTAELYVGTSYVFSNFGKPKEIVYGGNWYPGKNRNWRLNLHVINVDHSPVSSTFGFYMGQLKGTVVALGATALY